MLAIAADTASEPLRRVDVAIVGAGPAGIASATQAATRGISHVLLERSRIAQTIHRYQRGKWVMDEPQQLGLQPELQAGFQAGSREDVLARWESDIQSSGAHLLTGPEYQLIGLSGEIGAFRLQLEGGTTLECGRVILSLGVQGNRRRFGVPGEDLPHVTYQLDDPAAHSDQKIVVVGVGDAGLENALALVDHGNQVALVNRRAEMDRAKPRNRSLIEAAINAHAITYYPNTVTECFEPNAIVLRSDDGDIRLDADLVIGRLGATPPRALLESLGVPFPSNDKDAVPEVSETYESGVPGIHIIGALAGYPLIKNCMNQGFEVIEHILGNPVDPTDEPVLRAKFEGIDGTVSEILERIRSEIPIFGELTRIQLREFVFESDIRQVAAGEVIFERNEFSNTLLSILEGSVEIELPTSDHAADSDERGDLSTRRFHLQAGEFFGEGGLISGRRRSGTAVALSDCVLIESRRLTMTKLIRSVDGVRAEVDRTFIARTISNLLPSCSPEDQREAAQSATVRSYKPGEVLMAEGEEPDGVHLIRRGAVSVSVEIGGRDAVIQYVQAGGYVGDSSLLEQDRRRGATVTATTLTETILLPAHSVRALLDRNPELRSEFRLRESEQLVTMSARSTRSSRDIVSFLLESGAYEATDLLLIDESLCIRCDNCETACANTHDGITRLDREAGPTYTDHRGVQLHIPTACQHCEHPKCMDDCPPDALRRHPNGEVYIMDNCIGCGNCVTRCPYDVIALSTVTEKRPRSLLMRLLLGERPTAPASSAQQEKHTEIATKCDLCRNVPRRGGASAAACVSACPTGAIVRVDPREFVDEIYQRQG